MGHLYRKLHSIKRLRNAWSVVHRNGISSKSVLTRKEITEFSLSSETHLARISVQLRDSRFKFSPSHGVAIRKANNPSKKRPIVVSPVENKILQRAILDVIQEIPEIAEKLNSRFNFGGVPEVAVPQAINKAYLAMLDKPYFIRTDIRAFFDNVPRPKALSIITSLTDDLDFEDILIQATNTELDNLVTLGRDKELFPLEDKGVAQGSCLSPMICNLLLHDFDEQMNRRGVVCIRYIDDFILFAKDQSSAFKAFDAAKQILNKLGLSVYDPRTDTEKAEHGLARRGYQFLGCDIREDRIRPALKSQKRLKERVDQVFKNAVLALKDPKKSILDGKTYRDALYELSNVIRGWGNSYAFCTDDHLMQNLDKAIDLKLSHFNKIYKSKLSRVSASDKRRLLGVYLLDDCKKEDESKAGTLRNLVKSENLRLAKTE